MLKWNSREPPWKRGSNAIVIFMSISRKLKRDRILKAIWNKN